MQAAAVHLRLSEVHFFYGAWILPAPGTAQADRQALHAQYATGRELVQPAVRLLR